MSCIWDMFLDCFNGGKVVKINERTVRLRKRLGDGLFGCVYLVKERDTGKLYAMKKIICHSKTDEERVENEIKVHRMVGHNPHMLPCEDYSVAPATVYEPLIADKAEPSGYRFALNADSPVEYNILLPYFKRGTLQEELMWRLSSGDFIKETRVWKLFFDVCQGLDALHSLQPEAYVHGDLKAANVLLSDDDRAVLMDFGSARPAKFEVKNDSQARYIQEYAAENCSMYYRAPELFTPPVGLVLDQRTDVWSLGCLLYAMCFWVSPFEEAANRGDSLPLIFLSLKYRIPSKSPYTKAVDELIMLMLETEFVLRPFLSDVIDRLNTMKPVITGS